MTGAAPRVAGGISRRRVLQRGAVGAAAVWAAPSVTTLGSRALAVGSPPPTVAGQLTALDLDFAQVAPVQFTTGQTLTDTSGDSVTVTAGPVAVVNSGTQFALTLQSPATAPAERTVQSAEFADGTYTVTVTYQLAGGETLTVSLGGDSTTPSPLVTPTTGYTTATFTAVVDSTDTGDARRLTISGLGTNVTTGPFVASVTVS